MSKFDYKAEGKLDSQYLLELLTDYLEKAEKTNDVNGIVEDNFNINVKSNKFLRFIKDKFKRIKFTFSNSALLENYNKVLSIEYIKNIKDKIQIFLQTNVLEPKQITLLKNTLNAINFDVVMPEIDENRYKVIKQARKRFLSCLNDVKYLKHANTEYILFNSPVAELKPFLSDKVSVHKVNVKELSTLVQQFIDVKCDELNNFEIEEVKPEFEAKPEDFYTGNITENGIGEEIEEFIRSKMLEKLNISKQEETLIEDRLEKIVAIDNLLKKLKLLKIERMLQKWIQYKTNIAQAKEVVDKCKDLINGSTLTNKQTIFLIMDNLYYKLTTACDKLQEQIKLKLQLVDKQKVFSMLETIEKSQKGAGTSAEDEALSPPPKRMKNIKAYDNNSIASNLYDDDDEEDEIHISEDDEDSDAEEEIVINEDKN